MEEIYDDFFAADLIVAHNAPFDIGFMINEFYRRERRFRYKEEFDTMRYFTPIMKLPRRNGAGYKFPKLTELGEFLDIYPYDVTKRPWNCSIAEFLPTRALRYDGIVPLFQRRSQKI